MLEMFRYLKMFIIVWARENCANRAARGWTTFPPHWASSSFTFYNKKQRFYLYMLAMNGWVDSTEGDLIWKGELVQPSSFNLDFYVCRPNIIVNVQMKSGRNSWMDLICERSKLPIIVHSRVVYEFLIEGGIKIILTRRTSGGLGVGRLITYFSLRTTMMTKERKQKENWKSNKLRSFTSSEMIKC